MMAFVLGGITLDFPPTIDNYRMVNAIVSGREATALSGAPLELGVIRKRVWTLTFYPGSQYSDLMNLVGTETTFVDHDGASYTVKVTGEPSISQYPLVDVGLLTLTLREV